MSGDGDRARGEERRPPAWCLLSLHAQCPRTWLTLCRARFPDVYSSGSRVSIFGDNQHHFVRNVTLAADSAVLLRARTCHSLHVGLWSDAFRRRLYEIVLQGWMKRGGQTGLVKIEGTRAVARSHRLSTPSLFPNCSQSRRFWLAWTPTHIRLGTGWTLYKHELLAFADSDVVGPFRPLKYLSFRSCCNGGGAVISIRHVRRNSEWCASTSARARRRVSSPSSRVDARQCPRPFPHRSDLAHGGAARMR